MVWCNQTFFVNNNDIKINKENYCRHLFKEFLPAIEKVVKRDGWIFAQDGTRSYRSHLVQDFAKTKFKCRFICVKEWPPTSPNVNSLDYFSRDFVKTKIFEVRSGKPFASVAELKKTASSVWDVCANDLYR